MSKLNLLHMHSPAEPPPAAAPAPTTALPIIVPVNNVIKIESTIQS